MMMGKESSTGTQRTSTVATPNKIHYTREQKHRDLYNRYSYNNEGLVTGWAGDKGPDDYTLGATCAGSAADASCTPPTMWKAHGSAPPVSIPTDTIRRRSITASMRAMICSESATALLLLAELLAITNR